MAVESNLEIFIGSARTLEFSIVDGADPTIAPDLSSAALSWMQKASLGDLDADALIEKTVGSGVTVSGVFNADAAQNQQIVTVQIAKADTVNQDERLTNWELKRTDTGEETTYAYGLLRMRRGVHRT